MITIQGRNVNEVFPIGLLFLKEKGILRNSRNGPVLEIMEPVSVTYDRPMERVLFNKIRDCNPFFHLFESLWMLAGRKDVQFLEQYNSRMKEYSDDGQGFNAAYGHRLRFGFGFDQMAEIAERLRRDPDDRRAVLQLWDCNDLRRDSKDYACNLVITPRIRNGALDWTVFNRSNDYLWGMLGANAVHMSVFQEWMAAQLGIPVGKYTQITNCLHVYVELPIWQRCKEIQIAERDNYYKYEFNATPIVTNAADFDLDLLMWMNDPLSVYPYKNEFFNEVATPMARVFNAYKAYKKGLAYCELIQAPDWKRACEQWLDVRENIQLDLPLEGGKVV